MNGSCICGAITYEVEGAPKSVVNCHCNMCRKMNGSAFSTYAAVLSDEFTLTSGEPKARKVSDNATKHFCGLNCATSCIHL